MDQSHQTSVQRDQQLFEDLVQPCTEIDAATAGRAADLSAPARVQQASRLQVELRASDLESLLPEDHRARLVWHDVERQDLRMLFDAIKARGSALGRRQIDAVADKTCMRWRTTRCG
jgi:hypothetical protein